MMNIFHAIILGIVEGVTEFLPISSTFHQIFTAQLLGITQTDFVKLFEVFIQPGAILAVCLLYVKEIITDQNLIKKTLVAFIPTAVIGLVLYKVIKTVFFESPSLMIAVFFIVGLLFILFEWFVKQEKLKLHKHITQLNYKDAIIIGLIKAFAVIPGVSRAGAVIVGMMLLNYRRDEAARFSFILAIPTIFAASALDLWKGKNILVHSGSNIIILVVGFIVSFISAYIVVKWFIDYLKKNSLAAFGYYRILFSISIILLLIFNK